MQRKDQRTNGNGTANDRRFITWAKVFNSLIYIFVAGGISVGGIQFTKQDTVDSLANVKMEQALLRNDYDNHIKNLEITDELKNENVGLKIHNIETKMKSIDKRLNKLETNSDAVKRLLEILVKDSTR